MSDGAGSGRKRTLDEDDARWWPPERLTDGQLLDRLRARNEATEIPRCRVCGDALTASRIGGGEPTVWTCSAYTDETEPDGRLIPKPGRVPHSDDDMEHHRRSEFVDRRHADTSVMEVIARFERATVATAPLRREYDELRGLVEALFAGREISTLSYLGALNALGAWLGANPCAADPEGEG